MTIYNYFSSSTPYSSYLATLASNETSVDVEDNSTTILPMSDEVAAQAIASALLASPEFFNPSDFPTFPESPWDDGLTTPALSVGAGMTPDIYTSPALMSFGDDFDSMPSLFDNLASEDCDINANSVPTSQSPPPPGSAANASANMNLAVDLDTVHAIAAVNNPPAAQPPRGQAQPPPQYQTLPPHISSGNLMPPPLRWEAPSAAPKADNETSHVDLIRPPEKLHPTLSCWLKNLNKFSSLIDRLQELASVAPPDLRPQLHEQVAMLRSSFKKQQERCLEFLRLTEEYADRYLLDISAEIQQQSSFLEMLEKRLDMAKTLHGQAMDLRKSYESGTVDAMKGVRKALLKPLPSDFDLFREVDFVLNEIRRCYMELDKFWTEEIRRAAKALETRRVDPDDAKRWRDFKASLEQTVKSWKTTKRGSSIWSTPQLSSSSGPDLGAIASVLSPALATLEKTLQRVRAGASIAFSPKNFALALRVGCGSTQNKEPCLTFFRRCISFAETIAASSTACMTHPTFAHVRTSNDLQERLTALRTEAADVSAESATQFQGSRTRRLNSVYKQCLSATADNP